MRTILIIDDDINIRKLFDLSLQQAGFKVLTASDGNAGLEMAVQHIPDAAILDVMMPGLHGYEVCRRLRANPDTAGIKIIFLTARSQRMDEQAGMQAGADLFLGKPVMPTELVHAINSLLDAPSAKAQAQPPQVHAVSSPPAASAPPATPMGAAPAPTATASVEAAPLSQGHLIACFSLTPGVGVTALSVNLALACALARSDVVSLIELHPAPAGLCQAMGLMPRSFPPMNDNLTWPVLQAGLVEHPGRVHVLPAPSAPMPPSPTWSQQALRLILEHYPLTVADMSRKPTPAAQVALAMTDLLLLVMSPDVASVRATLNALEGLQALKFPANKILLVVNHTQPEAALSIERIKEGMNRPILAVIPFASNLQDSLRAGRPLILADPRAPVSLAIGRMAVQLVKGLGLR